MESLIIFKTHLDIGFTDLAAKVKRRYFDTFIPAAIRTASEVRRINPACNYVWTVGSYLIYEYLERATPSQREELEQAVGRGDICWHAIPFTMHSELVDPALFDLGLSISTRLDERFGKQTVAAKMTDVPGHTRGIIAPLAARGIRFLHLGINPASTMPDGPPVFRWVDSKGNSIIVMYQQDYGCPLRLPYLQTLFSVTGDNQGPHTPEDALQIFADAGKFFPDSIIRAGNLNDLADKLIPFENELPVITSEIGDSWIHGIGSDPLKVARFKALSRFWKKEIPRNFQFAKSLLEVAEHTWGLDEKTSIPDEKRFLPSDFERMRREPRIKRFERSWREKQQLISSAVNLLEPAQRKMARDTLRKLSPCRRSRSGEKISEGIYRVGDFEFAFNPDNGTLTHLKLAGRDEVWADHSHVLGKIMLENFSAEDYGRFQNQYLRVKPEWAVLDFGKHFLPAGLGGGRSEVHCIAARKSDRQTFHFHLIPDRKIHGMPEEFFLRWRFHKDRKLIDITLDWFDKETSRIPHALWFSFVPPTPDGVHGAFQKSGEWIEANDVVSNGGRTMHAVEKLKLTGENWNFELETLDAPLISPECPSLLNFHNRLPDIGKGVHVNLYNNIWGTNFPMWFGNNCRFRFQIEL